MLDIVGSIIEYESGELEGKEILELFAELVRTGQAWSLQGHYGRTARGLIDRGLLKRKGQEVVVDWELFQQLSCQ